MLKIPKHAKNKARLGKGKEFSFWILDKISIEAVCFSPKFRKCNIADSVEHVELCTTIINNYV